MEVLLAAFLLFMGNSPETKQKLNEFLSFYRENREAITLLAQTLGKRSPSPQSAAPEQPTQQTADAEMPNLSLFEEFLARK
jgi:hypothetical protein